MEPTTVPLSGRRAQAALNDQLILEAARQVFVVADPAAPIGAVAERADVGMSALYRRYRSKEELLARLAGDGLRRYIAEAEAALADDGDPWAAFVGFMGRVVDADTHALVLRLAGTFTPTKDLYDDAERAQELNLRLLERNRAAGAVRADLDVNDLSFVFEQAARSASATRTAPASSATQLGGGEWPLGPPGEPVTGCCAVVAVRTQPDRGRRGPGRPALRLREQASRQHLVQASGATYYLDSPHP